ncbi:MAG: hypothetical protein E7464_02450 [Ruminococcaceae bacterium]|nr:hypothetical protein [Oscillospiraceae bacterium]
MKVEIIYEKKYPHDDLSLLNEQIEPNDTDTLEYKSFAELIESIQANTVYTLIPERVRTSKEFIHAAIKISEQFELDIRIERHIDRISVRYSFDCCGCLRGINRVFGMADQFYFFTDIYDHDITVVLDFFTHISHRIKR